MRVPDRPRVGGGGWGSWVCGVGAGPPRVAAAPARSSAAHAGGAAPPLRGSGVSSRRDLQLTSTSPHMELWRPTPPPQARRRGGAGGPPAEGFGHADSRSSSPRWILASVIFYCASPQCGGGARVRQARGAEGRVWEGVCWGENAPETTVGTPTWGRRWRFD